MLAAGTVVTTVQAEMLVGALQTGLAAFGFTELFVGVIVIAIVGNAAEHYSAITAGRRDEMTRAVEIVRLKPDPTYEAEAGRYESC